LLDHSAFQPRVAQLKASNLIRYQRDATHWLYSLERGIRLLGGNQ